VAAAAAAALSCTDAEPPAYTRVAGRAPQVVPRSGALLVVFWATWCPPCREELPGLLALARDPPARIALLTFGEDEDPAAVEAFFRGPAPRELELIRDHDGRAASAFGVDRLPAAFLVVDGRLVARFSGPRDWDSRAMRRLLAKLAMERVAPSRADAPPR
jgi:thioredoxin-like negative regulator of GroEL